jgi:hypothetical protein
VVGRCPALRVEADRGAAAPKSFRDPVNRASPIDGAGRLRARHASTRWRCDLLEWLGRGG